MLIGSSLSKCFRDIYDEKVSFSDVFVIVTNTNFDPTDDNHWNSLMNGYSHNSNIWNAVDCDKMRGLVLEYENAGKLFQPRTKNTSWSGHNLRVDHWYTLCPMNAHHMEHVAVRETLEQLDALIALTK